MAREKVNLNYIWEDRKRILFFGLPWTFTKYKLTEEKLLINSGLLTINFEEIRLYRILDISMRQTLLQRIFNIGTIKITSSDKTLPTLELKNIKNPEVVKEMLSEKIENERVKKRVSGREFMMEINDDNDDNDND